MKIPIQNNPKNLRYVHLYKGRTLSAFQVYLLAIGANLAFSTSSIFFSYFTNKYSSFWMNQAKVIISLMCFAIALLVTGVWTPISWVSAGILFLSGLIGLCLGDLMLFGAFTKLGPGRTLVMFSFGPLILGLYGFFFLAQTFSFDQTIAVICMIACIFIFMLEKKGTTGSWELKSFIIAFLAILLDNFGVMLTRTAYEAQPLLHSFQVNVIRCLGAISGFVLIRPKGYLEFFQSAFKLEKREKVMLIGASICGTFVSLSLYLSAVKHAHLGTLTAISITGPVWVSIIESIYSRKLPNLYLISAFTFFLAGFYFMVK